MPGEELILRSERAKLANVEKLSELESAMEECFALKDKLVFLDVYVDPDEHVYPMLKAGGDMSEMFLSKTEKTFE